MNLNLKHHHRPEVNLPPPLVSLQSHTQARRSHSLPAHHGFHFSFEGPPPTPNRRPSPGVGGLRYSLRNRSKRYKTMVSEIEPKIAVSPHDTWLIGGGVHLRFRFVDDEWDSDYYILGGNCYPSNISRVAADIWDWYSRSILTTQKKPV